MMVNYKDTLNILRTDFEMKANLNAKEPLFQNEWINNDIYQKILAKNKNNKQWILHDGPPYANGSIHIGHALNKIIKDIIIRYKNMQGFYSPYIPGWDTHGLPIEHALSKEGINKNSNLSISERRDNCKNFAIKQINNQIKQFSRLGLLTNFKEIYKTFDNDYEQRQLNVFLAAVKQNLIFQDLKPVYWSWSSQTALADAEIEYGNTKSASVYVSFNVCEDKEPLFKNDKLVIWTTTPWTIPSNLAICVHPNFKYVRVQVENDYYVVSKNRLKSLVEILGWTNYRIINEFDGNELEHVKYKHPLYERSSPIILGDYVTDDDGTGLVHNAPGFGADDYLVCKKYGIKPYAPIDNHGKFTKEINDSQLVGIFYDDSNKLITERLKQTNALLKLDFVNHSVALDWRTKKPVIYRATKQWFININKIHDKLMSEINGVNFTNEKNKKHIIDMIKNRSEWCISRQRIWGVPIPIIFDENKKSILDEELITNIINIIKNESSNIWFEKPVEYFLTNKYKNMNGLSKEIDILDVWFDSGTSWTLLKELKLNYPSNLYFEGNDQYRGWFNSSLINGVIANGQCPYKTLLSHGFVLDEQGRKMSKSIGNVIDPLDICNKYGADILRLIFATCDYQDDVRFSENMIQQVSETYRRIRNTLFKFILANISDYELIDNPKYSEVDLRILNELQENIDVINKNGYEKYNFALIIKVINNHVIKLSSWYFDVIKDILYCEKKNDVRRRAIQSVLYHILHSYLILLTPILPHTCEEVYKFFNKLNKCESIHLENWINKLNVNVKHIDVEKWKSFDELKDLIYSKLEEIRNSKVINKNTEAIVKITFDNKFNFNEQELKQYLNVAKVIIESKDSKEIKVNVDNAKLIKCERCWNHYEKQQMHDEHICRRCDGVLSK